MVRCGRLRETVFFMAILAHPAVCKTGRCRKITDNRMRLHLGILCGWTCLSLVEDLDPSLWLKLREED